MNKINLRDIPELEQRSPTGKFHSFSKNVSLALGGIRNVGSWGGGHPFDFQVRRIPPGAAVCPLHAHIVQWEMFVVRRGTGTVRVGDERREVRAGDCFLHPPGEAHQLINTGREDLEVFILADNPQLDGFWYPDSQKWGLRTPSVFFKMTPVDYFEGEDTVIDAPSPVPALPQPASPFSARCKNLDDIAWENWSSPKGKFRGSFRGVSLAFGAKHREPLSAGGDKSLGLGGHPFDLEFGRVPPHSALFPMHWHALQWEFYVFLEGRGEFRLGDARFPIEPGDCVMAAPHMAHAFTNTGDSDLHYMIVADDPPSDFWCYTETQKYGHAKPRKIFRATDADWLEGEE
jgi:uncharacterized cupin superfamily protein